MSSLLITSDHIIMYASLRSIRRFSTAPRLFNESLNILYDSKCSLCRVEIKFLRERDETLNRSKKLRFTDVEDNYDENAVENGNTSYEQAMSRICAVTQQGEVLSGVKAIRAAYAEVNLGWLYSFLQLPLAGKTADFVYDIWARERTSWTRGEKLEDIFAQRRAQRGEEKCSSSTCAVK
jgi:predicted DCC family thiol-disulfide oxidoreductase YuxK